MEKLGGYGLGEMHINDPPKPAESHWYYGDKKKNTHRFSRTVVIFTTTGKAAAGWHGSTREHGSHKYLSRAKNRLKGTNVGHGDSFSCLILSCLYILHSPLVHSSTHCDPGSSWAVLPILCSHVLVDQYLSGRLSFLLQFGPQSLSISMKKKHDHIHNRIRALSQQGTAVALAFDEMHTPYRLHIDYRASRSIAEAKLNLMDTTRKEILVLPWA